MKTRNKWATFRDLNNYQLFNIVQLRQEVLINEKEHPYQELDDQDQCALHLLILLNKDSNDISQSCFDVLIAYVRLQVPKYHGCFEADRIVIAKNYRTAEFKSTIDSCIKEKMLSHRDCDVTEIKAPEEKINWQWLTFSQMSTLNLYRIFQLRSKNYMEIQKYSYVDPDDKDLEPTLHVLNLKKNDKQEYILAAYARLLFSKTKPHEAEVGRVMVHPDMQRKGLGKKLMKEIGAKLDTENLRARLEISDDEFSGHLEKFYKRSGFKKTGQFYVEFSKKSEFKISEMLRESKTEKCLNIVRNVYSIWRQKVLSKKSEKKDLPCETHTTIPKR